MPGHKAKPRIRSGKKSSWPPNPDKATSAPKRKERAKARREKEVNDLYNKYQASQYFSNRGGYQRRPKDLKITSGELCRNSMVTLVLFGSVLGILYSILTIAEAGDSIRETEVGLYEQDEKMWNTTYLNEFKQIGINLIQDGFMYDQNSKEIEIQEILIGALQKKLEVAEEAEKTGLNKKIQDAGQLLKELQNGQKILKIPLKQKEEESGNKSESHLLNKQDEQGDLPEYEPYSLMALGYTPLARWEKAPAGSDELYQKLQPTQIQDSEEFIKLEDKNHSILFEIEEADGKTQIIRIENQQYLKSYHDRLIQKGRQRLSHCHLVHGYYDPQTHVCTQYFWVEEMCVSIAKSNITGLWQLQGGRYNTKNWGCAFKPKDHPSYMLQWPDERNNKVVWQKMYLDSRHPKEQFFPLQYQPLEFHVRHAGDPLLAALNINHSLNFGMSSTDKKSAGVTFLIISIFVLMIGLWHVRTVCFPEYDIFKNSAQEKYEKGMAAYQKRIGRYQVEQPDGSDNEAGEPWQNRERWPEQRQADDFHNLQEDPDIIEQPASDSDKEEVANDNSPEIQKGSSEYKNEIELQEVEF